MTYTYRRADGSTFETQQRITDDALTVCPTTGQAVERVIHKPLVSFQGGGWAQDKYHKPNP